MNFITTGEIDVNCGSYEREDNLIESIIKPNDKNCKQSTSYP